MFMCWYCGDPITLTGPIGRSQTCLVCGKDLRACKNCRFFLSVARGDCKETQAQAPSDKERANFCDWFSLDEKFKVQSAGKKNEMDKAAAKSAASRSAFDNLFN